MFNKKHIFILFLLTLLIISVYSFITAEQNSNLSYIEYEDGIYEGDIVDGKRNGYGVMRYENGDKYEGYWRDDVREGEGVYIWFDMHQFKGLWQDNKPCIDGQYTMSKERMYKFESQTIFEEENIEYGMLYLKMNYRELEGIENEIVRRPAFKIDGNYYFIGYKPLIVEEQVEDPEYEFADYMDAYADRYVRYGDYMDLSFNLKPYYKVRALLTLSFENNSLILELSSIEHYEHPDALDIREFYSVDNGYGKLSYMSKEQEKEAVRIMDIFKEKREQRKERDNYEEVNQQFEIIKINGVW